MEHEVEVEHEQPHSPVHRRVGIMIAIMCWVGFVATSSFANALFSQKPLALWAIDSGFNLVSYIAAGAILGAWR